MSFTITIADALQKSYDTFNEELFHGELPACVITLQRHAKCHGYFMPDSFEDRDGTFKVHEIAINPAHMKERTVEAVLSTLLHEMIHLWQQEFGSPSKVNHHNAEWGAKMKELGLYPSSTGEPGGKETGRKVSHYIMEDGAFASIVPPIADMVRGALLVGVPRDEAKARKKAASKTKYSCPDCGTNAWAKPDTKLICGECDQPMIEEIK